MKARAGDWVQIHQVVLEPEQRTGKLPEDTRAVPFRSWSKGYLLTDAEVGAQVEIDTVLGRRLIGELVAVNPGYDHGFGSTYLPELQQVGAQARCLLAATASDEEAR
ncbi:2-amino-4-oxopentanoate thiolase subunit OrtA [Austwickia chelonae]|uniref:2-amino-4-oxopentanoate thiolase subunit OrtA n=1 Tax=Austwickia chelonae TaxID=100225 RepID=UPI000E27DAC5|nr:2-amino-4-oxopentanoate thiolase subunit OrtA [Austwickia chelonae]